MPEHEFYEESHLTTWSFMAEEFEFKANARNSAATRITNCIFKMQGYIKVPLTSKKNFLTAASPALADANCKMILVTYRF